MKSIKISVFVFMLFAALKGNAQTENSKPEIAQITETLMNYIEGTANGEPDRLKKAFHPNFNLYTVTGDSLRTRSGEKYIADIKPGEKTNRIGRIIAIDYEKDAATAKAEIVIRAGGFLPIIFYCLNMKALEDSSQKLYLAGISKECRK
jgi:hypothetical protein